MLDDFIEHWSGPALITSGVIALALAAGGYFHILPPPFSLRSDIELMLGPGHLSFASEMLLWGGIVLIAWGGGIVIHFREERQNQGTTRLNT